MRLLLHPGYLFFSDVTDSHRDSSIEIGRHEASTASRSLSSYY
jgi:hypothetical protein